MEKANITHGLTAEQVLELRSKKKQDLKDEEAKALREMLTVRQRLERKLQTDEVKLELDDDLGKFALRFRKLSPLEHDEVAAIQQGMKDSAKTKELTERLYEILGAASLDGLDAEFWRSGTGYSPDVLVAAMIKVMSASAFPDQKYLDEILKFR